MKRTLLFTAALLCMGAAVQAQQLVPSTQKYPAQGVKATYNSCDVTFLSPVERVSGLEVQAPLEPKAAAAPVRKARLARLDAPAAEADTVQYYAVAQSYHSNYQFKPEGGDVFGYNIGLCIDGGKATITNLFNMLASSTSWSISYDYPVEGVYDAEAGTITIPTTTEGIPCGSYSSGYYEAMLVAGEVSENGVLTPAEELVFDLTFAEDGSVATLTAASSFAARYTYGNIMVYKSFTANIPQEDVANVMTFTESVDFGEAFVGMTNSRSFMLINNGGMDADFVIELEAEDDAFTCSVDGGTVPACGTYMLDFNFMSPNAGTFEGIVTVIYETGSGEASLVVDLAGSAKNYPDYSGAIESGDFTVTTGFEQPFEPTILEDGTQVAKSGGHGAYGSSWLNLAFNVPEGKSATIAWKGMNFNKSSWYCSAGYFIDTLNSSAYYTTADGEDISGSYEFAPGEHFIRFQYDCNRYTGLEDNFMYVYGISYNETTLNADSAKLVTPTLALGNGVLPVGGSVQKTGNIVLKNLGANTLAVNKVEISDSEFTCDLSGLTGAATMEQLYIPVTLEAKTSGVKSATAVIETTAGTFTAEVTANIMEMPDFGSLVVEGAEYITSWSMNEEFPFEIVDGKARNVNAGDNSVYSTSWFKMDLDIPEGKLAYVSWKGVCAGRPVVEGSYDHYYSSYFTMELSHPMVSGTASYWESEGDASSDYLANNESWSDYLACVPGHHYYKWGWYHNGDGTAPEGDFVEIWDIQIHVIDFEDHAVQLETPEVTFEPTFVGYNRYTTATVTLRNIGSAPLEVLGYEEGSNPFYGIENTFPTQFNKTINLTLWFYPEEAGTYDGEIVIKTNAGDVTVPCHGVARDAEAEGIAFVGDFEDDAYGWSTVDADQNSEAWDLGSNLWGNRPEYCHSGSQCLASVSYSNWYGPVIPDNWTLSPVITLPENVTTTLSYYIAAFSPYRWEEHYSLYVVEYDGSTLDVNDIAANVEPLISETMTEEAGEMDGWQYREFDLADYAGKEIVLCFRHHECEGQYLLRLDDVFVRLNEPIVGLNAISNNANNSVEIFSVDGRKAQSLSNGINIVRTRQADGSIKAEKVMK